MQFFIFVTLNDKRKILAIAENNSYNIRIICGDYNKKTAQI